MRHTEKETVTRVQTKVTHITCDICHQSGKPSYGDDAHWEKESGDVSETQVRLKEGTAYPEGGSGVETRFDICPDCFKSKLIPFLEMQGAKVEAKDWDF